MNRAVAVTSVFNPRWVKVMLRRELLFKSQVWRQPACRFDQLIQCRAASFRQHLDDEACFEPSRGAPLVVSRMASAFSSPDSPDPFGASSVSSTPTASRPARVMIRLMLRPSASSRQDDIPGLVRSSLINLRSTRLDPTFVVVSWAASASRRSASQRLPCLTPISPPRASACAPCDRGATTLIDFA